ncbi:hypothetical protein RDMS_08860 [Deinococcus sp. RL]|nr:hypothetical protein RDMS_08860 [Deinococcus sp. RL]
MLGTAHVASGQPCQDAHAVRLIVTGQDEPLLLLVTSDGAGSAAFSQEGSRLVCDETIRWLEMRLCGADAQEFLRAEDAIGLVYNLRTLLTNHAEDRGITLRDLACTLSAAAVLPDRQWFVQVGDGATVIQPVGGVPSVVFWPDNGEYANMTYFVTDVPDTHVHAVVTRADLERVALLTDGLQTLALSLRDRAAHAPFFEPMFRAVESLPAVGTEEHAQLNAGLAAFLDSPAVNARTSDDKTLILASRRAPPLSTPTQVRSDDPSVEPYPAGVRVP